MHTSPLAYTSGQRLDEWSVQAPMRGVILSMRPTRRTWRAGLLLLCSVLFLAATGVTVSAEHWAVVVGSLRGKVVAIDPGHGGIDPGAISADGLTEDAVNLAVSRDLAELLERSGATAILTRRGAEDSVATTDAGPSERKRIDLRHRVAQINLTGADVVVSIHANKFSDATQRGSQTFYNPVRFQQSQVLAKLVQHQLQLITKETGRTASDQIDHYLLNHTNMPGITVELGFLSNPRDAQLLASPKYQQRLAYAIFVGLAQYFAQQVEAAR